MAKAIERLVYAIEHPEDADIPRERLRGEMIREDVLATYLGGDAVSQWYLEELSEAPADERVPTSDAENLRADAVFAELLAALDGDGGDAAPVCARATTLVDEWISPPLSAWGDMG